MRLAWLPRHPAVAYLFLVRSMHASLIFAYITCLLLCFTHQGLSQIGQTKEELIRDYGPCQPNAAGKPKEPNAYDSVIDVGEDCTFQSGKLIITTMFKDGKSGRLRLPGGSDILGFARLGRTLSSVVGVGYLKTALYRGS